MDRDRDFTGDYNLNIKKIHRTDSRDYYIVNLDLFTVEEETVRLLQQSIEHIIKIDGAK